MRRDEKRHLYYSYAINCYNQGLITEKQYNLILKALEDDDFVVEYKSSPIVGGFTAQFVITIRGEV